MSGTLVGDRKRLGWWLKGMLVGGLLVGQAALFSQAAWSLNVRSLDQEILAQNAQADAIVKTLDRSPDKSVAPKARAQKDDGLKVVLLPAHLRRHTDSVTK